MSGLKFSPVEFEREIQAREMVLSGIASSRTRIEGLKSEILRNLDEIPDGAWKRSPEIAGVKSWINGATDVYIDSTMNSNELQKIESDLKRTEKMAREMLGTVVDIKVKARRERRVMLKLESINAGFKWKKDLLEKWKSSDSERFREKIEKAMEAVKRGDFSGGEIRAADLEHELKNLIKEAETLSKEAKLMSELESIDAEFKGAGELLEKWKSSDSERFREKIERAMEAVKGGDLSGAKARIPGLEDELRDLIEEAEKLESKDRMRRHVLSSVKEVAERMGWKEVSEPYLEDDKDPSSPLIYELKSYSAGKMRFSLTMDRIEVESPFSGEDGACYEQFDRFSEKLQEYGIRTKFEGNQGGPRNKPALKEKKAKRLPESRMRRI